MKFLFFYLTLCLFSKTSLASILLGGGEFEDEFSHDSQTKLPLTYSVINGLSFDYFSQRGDTSENEDNLFSDITGLSVNASPTAFISKEGISRLINLDKAPLNSLEIQTSTTHSPYLHIHNKKWDLGLGGEIYGTIPSNVKVTGIGISLIKGKNYYSIKNLQNKNEIRPSLMLPTTLEHLKRWRPGDQLFFASRGGVVFNFFIGYKPIISLGPEYVHYGSYRVKAHLISINLMEIEITTTKTDSIALETSSIPMTVEWMKSQSHINSLVYQFDLNHPASLEAIYHLFSGRVDLTNSKMINSHGRIKLSTNIDQQNISFSGRFGIPVVYVSGGSAGMTDNEGMIETYDNNQKTYFRVFSHSRIKELFTRGFASDQKWFSESISTTLIRGINTDLSLLGSIYSWSYSKEKMKLRNLKNKFETLSNIFRKPKLKEIKFPAKKPGYVKAELNINFSGADILFLLREENLEKLRGLAINQLTKDFERLGSKAFCKIKSHIRCFNDYQNQIYLRLDSIKSLTQSLRSEYAQDRLRSVNRRLTRIISILLSSPHLVQSYALERKELKLELRLEGENIKQHFIEL